MKGAYFVSGPSGVGKTTLVGTLRELGYNARDIDDGLGNFVHSNGTVVPTAEIRPHDEEWSRHHRWTLDHDKLIDELKRHSNDHIFICGATRNQYNFFDLFERIFFLNADPDTLRSRLDQDREHGYGKYDFQRRKVLEDVAVFTTRMRTEGAVMINAEQAPLAVAHDIIAVIKGSWQ